jgi:hypothetical protein
VGVTPAKLHCVDSQPPLRVTLSGDVSGHYVIVEKRSDGSLVVAPDTSKQFSGATRRSASHVGTLLSGLLTPTNKTPMSDVEILEGWGVELREDELISDFFVADVDDRTGFLAVTSQRFIFAADTGRGLTIVQEHLLSAASNVELVRRGFRHKLRVTWHGVESLIGTPDRKALSRLQDHLKEPDVA